MFDYRYLSSVSEEDVAFSSNPFENATTTNTSEIDIVGSGDPSADERSISMLAQKEIIAIVLILPIIFILIIGFTCCFCPGFFSKIDDCVNNIGSQSDRVYGDAVVRRQIEEEEKNKEDPDERRARLDKHFEKHRVKMSLTKESFLDIKVKRSDTGLTEVDSDEEMQMETPQQCEEEDSTPESLYLPESISDEEGLEKPAQNGGRNVTNCCAICLCEYEVDENIVWSNNKSCKHAFHECCILDYLQNQKESPCPCCRLPFSDLLPKNGKVKNDDEIPRGRIWSGRRFMTRMLRRVRYSTVEANATE